MLDVLNKLIDKFICKKYNLEFSVEVSERHFMDRLAYTSKWEVNNFVITLKFDANNLWYQNVEDDLDIIIKSTGGDIVWVETKNFESYRKCILKIYVSYYIK